MSEFNDRISEIFGDYFRKHEVYPKSVSMSVSFRDALYSEPSTQIRISNIDSTNYWRGIPVKFVFRKNYIEFLPRKKPEKKMEYGFGNPYRLPYMGCFTPCFSMPGLITSS